MRYATIEIGPVEKLHPLGGELHDEPVDRVALHQMKLLNDDSCIALMEVSGDLSRLRSIMADHPSVIDYTVTGDREGFSFSYTNPTPLGAWLLKRREAAEMLIQRPSEFTAEGDLRMTLIGNAPTFSKTIPMVPDELRVDVKATGPYRPDLNRLESMLTDRQREVLNIAITEGYYEEPRETTQDDLATVLGLAPGTVGQHLRRIEAKVFSDNVFENGVRPPSGNTS